MSAAPPSEVSAASPPASPSTQSSTPSAPSDTAQQTTTEQSEGPDQEAVAGPFAYDLLDERSVQAPRAPALIISELAPMETMLKEGKLDGDGSQQVREIADRYSELRAAAERDARSGTDVEKANEVASAAGDKAIAYYERLFSKYRNYPKRDEAVYFAAIESIHRDKLSGARQRIVRLIEEFPGSSFVPQAYFALGELFRLEAVTDAVKWPLAAAAYQQAASYPVEQNRVRCVALMRRSTSAEAYGQRDEAAQLASEAVDCIQTNASSQAGVQRVTHEATKAKRRLGAASAQ